MGNYNNFRGDVKVHSNNFGSFPTMFQWNPKDYKKFVGRVENAIGKKQRMSIRKAIHWAAYEAAKTGRQETKRLLAEATTLKPDEINKRVGIYKHGSPLSMAIGMKISDTARPLSDFAFTPKKPQRTIPTVEIYRGEKKSLPGDLEGGRGAFVAKMPSGHVGLFEREKGKRRNYDAQGGYDMGSAEHTHLASFPGPSVTGLFKANETVHRQVWDKIFEKFEILVLQELKSIFEGRE
jgi:hypothetical protein